MTTEFRIRQQGDRCLIVDLGDQIDESVGLRCLALADKLRTCAIDGILDIVPSFISVAVYYEPRKSLGKDPAHALRESITQQLASLESLSSLSTSARSIDIPICYGGVHGPDLDETAALMKLTPDELVKAHHTKPSRVYMLGFAPGHPYLGIHDERFAIPRRSTPRTAVPAGSLGIANRQSTIYPNRLPGGWQIIGATPLSLFNPGAQSPTLLLPGDEVHFKPICAEEFEHIKATQCELRSS